MKKKRIKPNYNRQKAIEYLEKWFDVWRGDEDWWGGTDTWDINVFTDIEVGGGEYQETGHWFVNAFGIEQDEDGGLHADTNSELDYFEFKTEERN